MRFVFGLVLILIGLCILDCRAKPTSETSDSNINLKHDKLSIEDENESDMLMEPNEYSHVSVIKSEGKQIFPALMTTATTRRSEYGRGLLASSSANIGDESMNPIAPDSHSQAAQNFYPPFFRESQPLGHSRPYFPQSPSSLSSSSDGVPHAKFLTARSFDQSILGSGDFGVMTGGTFYSDDETPLRQEDNSDYNLFYGENGNSGSSSSNINGATNGRGRSQLPDSYIQKFTYPEEQFANFRDFADINTPSDSAYSQFVVVYANKNTTASTSSSIHPNPKNIFEQLQLLDQEKEMEQKKNRLSKTKSKLANTKFEKKYKKKIGPKDQDYEPLLALS